MGVTKLWEILKDVKTEISLEQLSGQTLAVDLAVWVCEAEGVKPMQNYIQKPYLRNLFFRVNSVLKAGVKLVFVLDGKAPDLKLDTIAHRLASSAKSPTKTSSGVRKRLNAKFDECRILLDNLGIPWIKAEGEAEAFCAELNKQGLVEGVVTNDGDCFLYGAKTVYRNFSVDKKDVPIECYTLYDIEKELHLNQRGLIALGLLLGCDYCPKGVPGVGRVQAVKLLSTWKGKDPLDSFNLWRKNSSFQDAVYDTKKPPHCSKCGHQGSKRDHCKEGCSTCGDCSSRSYDSEEAAGNITCTCLWHQEEEKRKKHALENKVRNLALKDPKFPDANIIQEFLTSKRCDHQHSDLPARFKPKAPTLDKACIYVMEKLGWELPYAFSKVLPMLTNFFLESVASNSSVQTQHQIEFNSIIRSRIRNHIRSLEVEWTVSHDNVDLDLGPECQRVTVEPEESVRKAYPEAVQKYYKDLEIEKAEKKEAQKEARKLERKKKSEKLPPSHGHTITDFFKAKKTRDMPASRKNTDHNVEQGVHDIEALEMSLASLSLATQGSVKQCDAENNPSSSHAILFSSDSDEGDPKTVTGTKSDSPRREVKMSHKVGSQTGFSSDENLDTDVVKIANLTASDTPRLRSDITFSDVLDFSLGCDGLCTPLQEPKTPKDDSFCIQSESDEIVAKLGHECRSALLELHTNVLAEKSDQDSNSKTPEKVCEKNRSLTDSPVYMTLMERLKARQKPAC